MKKTFLIDPVKTGLAGAFSIFLMVLLPEFFRQQNHVALAIFGLVCLIFLGITLYSARLITVDKKSMTISYFGLFKKEYPWDEVREIGVCGLKVFKGSKSKATGLLYIYFSEQTMTDEERFDMVLKWPRAHIPYMLYTRKRLETIQFLWEKPLKFYNADKVKFYYQ